jgi:hypothetical protein
LQSDNQITCKNCGQTAGGNYCKHCGQKTSVDRINLSNFITEITETIFQIDRGFFYTVKSLMLHPGKAIEEYLQGKRKKYFKPVAYLLALSTFYFLITQIFELNTWLEEFIIGWMEGPNDKENSAEVPALVIWFSKNYAYSTLFLLPVFSLASYIAFYNHKKNYLEHLVLNSYITGHQSIFYIFFAVLLSFIQYDILEAMPFLFSVMYTFLVFIRLFKKGSKWKTVLQTIITYLLYLLFIILLLFILLAFSR